MTPILYGLIVTYALAAAVVAALEASDAELQ